MNKVGAIIITEDMKAQSEQDSSWKSQVVI